MTPKTLLLSDGTHATCTVAGAGEPLVLVHGVGMCAEAWAPQIEALSRSHEVISVDMPGHGGSDRLPEGVQLPDYVAWLGRVLDALGRGAVNLAGHSMGGLVALGCAIEMPERVRRLAVLNSVHRRSPGARDAVRERARAISRGEGDDSVPLRRWFGETPGERAVRDRVSGWLERVDRAGYAAAYAAFAEGDETYADRWGEIACPTLVLTGAEDGNSTPEMARAMAGAARRGRAVVVPNERHMVGLTAPEAVTAEMRRWLEEPIAAERREMRA